MEELQDLAPEAKFLKCFSCVGAAAHGKPGI